MGAPMRHPFRTAAFVVVVVALLAAAWVRVPYYALGPGPAQSVTPLIDYANDEPRYEPTGQLVMTTVRYFQLSPLTALWAWVDPDLSVIPRSDLFVPGVPEDVQNQRAISQMDQSKIDATALVLKKLDGYPKEHGRGALVESTVPDCPADGQLFPGDVIIAIDGKPVGSVRDASKAIEAAKPGQQLDFRVNVDGTIEHARFTRRRCVPNDPRRLVGVEPAEPVPVRGLDRERQGRWALRRSDVGPGALRADDARRPDVRTNDRRHRDDRSAHGRRRADRRDPRQGDRRGAGRGDRVPGAGGQHGRAPKVDTGGMQVISVSSFDDAVKDLEADRNERVK